ncbi:ComEC/Rec2 family competence protein [Acidomonas methanolica]|nr:ComEC/Rec2 family competence protein [Acidomonas methanolica]
MGVPTGGGLTPWLPVCFGAGAAAYFLPAFEPAAWPALLGLCLAAAGGAVWRGRGVAAVLPVMLLLGSMGFLDAMWSAHRREPMPFLPGRAVVLHAVVAATETVSRDEGEARRRLVLRDGVFESGVDIGMAPLRRVLRVMQRADDPARPEVGARVRLRALLRPPAPPAVPGGRDVQREAWFSGLAGSGRALGPVTLLSPGSGGGLESLREAVAARVAAALPGQVGAIAATLLAGKGERIDRAVRQDFAASGLSHLLAVAGLHLGLVMAAVIVTLRLGFALWRRAADHWPCKEIAVCAGFVAGAGYVLLTGAHLPAVRALGMAAIGVLAVLTGRRVLSMRALALVALGVLVVAPESVLDVSFQMSFAAVMGLIAGYDALRPWLRRARSWLAGHGLALVLTSLLAGSATLPVSLAHFGVLQPWFVLANLVAVPLAAVWIMPLGLAALLLMPLHLAGGALAAMGAGIALVMRLAHAVAGLPLAQTAVPAMPGWGIAAYFLGLCWVCLGVGRLRLAGIGPVLLALASPWLVARPVVLVAPDAGVMAVREGGVLAFGPVGGLDRGVEADWLRSLALPRGVLAGCEQGLCRVGGILLRVRDRSDGEVLPVCDGVTLFVSVSPARGACAGRPVVDRFSVWRDGAYAAYRDGDGWRLVSDRSWRGERLWVPPPGGRGRPNLPLAPAE